MHKQICVQICAQTLWCCMQPVWTLPFACSNVSQCIACEVPSARCSASCVNRAWAWFKNCLWMDNSFLYTYRSANLFWHVYYNVQKACMFMKWLSMAFDSLTMHAFFMSKKIWQKVLLTKKPSAWSAHVYLSPLYPMDARIHFHCKRMTVFFSTQCMNSFKRCIWLVHFLLFFWR